MNKSDEVLILSAKKGSHESSEALAELCRRYAPLLHKAAHQSHLAAVAEDALGEANIAFIEAVQAFDETRGVPFAGYAREMVYGRLRTFFKRERRKWQREVYPTAICDDEGDETDFWDTLATEGDDFADWCGREDLAAALKTLTPRQREVITLLYLAGLNQMEAAKKLGISQQAVAKNKKAAMVTLKKFYD